MATREQYEAEKKALDSLIESKQAYQELALEESANLKDYIKIQKQYEIAVKLNLDTQEALREELEVRISSSFAVIYLISTVVC